MASVFDIPISASNSDAVSSPFDNNAYLVVGSNPYISGGGVSGSQYADPVATSIAATGSSGTGYGQPASASQIPFSSSVATLLNSTNFWLAAGAVLTVILIIKLRKK